MPILMEAPTIPHTPCLLFRGKRKKYSMVCAVSYVNA